MSNNVDAKVVAAFVLVSIRSLQSLNPGSGFIVLLMTHQVVFQFGHGFLQDAIVVLLEPHQLWEAGNKKPYR